MAGDRWDLGMTLSTSIVGESLPTTRLPQSLEASSRSDLGKVAGEGRCQVRRQVRAGVRSGDVMGDQVMACVR